MKSRGILWLAMFMLAGNAVWAASAPRHLGGFSLGEDIKRFESKVDMSTMLPLRYIPTLKEVKISPQKGIKSGLIYYGTCSNEGRIIRIRLKFSDSSRGFFKTLLKKYKSRFGKPEWRGDSFGIVVAWKWAFVDAEGNNISLIIQHNTRDPDQRVGNAVKMTMTNLMQEERACWQKNKVDAKQPKPASTGDSKSIDWERFIPY